MALSRAASGSTPGFSEIIGKGELCLLAVALSAVGLGEIQGATLKGERTGIVLGGASLINLAVSMALYVMMKSSTEPSALQMIISSVFFVSTLIVSTSCIAVSEVADA